jgi:PilZ domain
VASGHRFSGEAGALAVEYRSAPRHRILQRCLARPAGSAAPAEGWRSIAYDISATGVGVTLPVPLARGSMLEIEPYNLPGGRPLRARVVHAHRLEFVWLCGCELDRRLNDRELQTWLAAPPA